ncbi:MAG: nucleotidyltransferase domain-containing protein [Chloroflexota bacterium]
MTESPTRLSSEANKDPRLDEAVRRLVCELKPSSIFLYGSRARGDWNQHSDYDIMVLVDYPVDHPYRLTQRAYRALRGLRLPVEVIVMNRDRFEWLSTAAASLAATVKREGNLLYAA